MNTEYEIISKIIRERRSIFTPSFIAQEIPVTAIDAILESANYAPTHKLTQPWRFIVIRKEGRPKLGKALGEIYKSRTSAENFTQKKYDSFSEKILQANCVIAINMHVSGKLPEWEELASVACAVQNMALTAESLKIGAYWSSPDLIHHLGDFLDLSENEKCIGLFYMGYHQEPIIAARRTPMTEKVRWIEE